MFSVHTQRLHSSSFLGLPYRVPKNEPLKGTAMEPMGNCVLKARLYRELE